MVESTVEVYDALLTGSKLAGSAFMSKNFGSTWVQIFSTGIPRSIAMSADGQKLLMGTGIGVDGYLYTSSDARVWTKRF